MLPSIYVKSPLPFEEGVHGNPGSCEQFPLPFNSGPALPVPFFGRTIRTAVEDAIDFSSMTNNAAATGMFAASLEGPERSFPELAGDAPRSHLRL